MSKSKKNKFRQLSCISTALFFAAIGLPSVLLAQQKESRYATVFDQFLDENFDQYASRRDLVIHGVKALVSLSLDLKLMADANRNTKLFAKSSRDRVRLTDEIVRLENESVQFAHMQSRGQQLLDFESHFQKNPQQAFESYLQGLNQRLERLNSSIHIQNQVVMNLEDSLKTIMQANAIGPVDSAQQFDGVISNVKKDLNAKVNEKLVTEQLIKEAEATRATNAMPESVVKGLADLKNAEVQKLRVREAKKVLEEKYNHANSEYWARKSIWNNLKSKLRFAGILGTSLCDGQYFHLFQLEGFNILRFSTFMESTS